MTAGPRPRSKGFAMIAIEHQYAITKAETERFELVLNQIDEENNNLLLLR
jgi:hypothetical protein